MKLTLHPRALLVLATLLSTVGYLCNFQHPILAAAPPLTVANPSDLTVPVIQHPSSQEFPDIDQQHVVWQDFRFGPTDIFMADLQTHAITNLTETDTWEVQPDLEGDLVVWKDGYQGIGIHGLNITTGERFTATEGHADVSRPHLSGNIVVWADNRAGADDWNIYGYDLAKKTEFVIADGPGNQVDPQIDGNFVVWWDHQFRIYLYQVDTKQTKTIVDTYSAQLPDVSSADHLVVWQDFRNSNWDIYAYDLTTQTERPVVVEPDDQANVVIANGLVVYQSQILGVSWNIQLHVLADNATFGLVDNSNAQTQPAVSGNGVVWQDLRNHQSDIYRFTWTGIIPPLPTHAVAAPANLQVGAFPAHKIYLQWQDNALDETGYKVERAQGITGTTWSEIASLRANTTVYTDTPTLLGESYWYRVRAYNTQGDSAYSNESFNSTIDNVPNPNELYLMVLINEARAAPAVFGYPAYPPVPPLAYNPLIAYSAHSHSQSILNSVFQFGHCDPIGRCPTERVRAVGYPGGCGENLTTGNTGYQEIEGANQSFMDSPPHRENMLAADHKEFGVGNAYDINKGEPSRHGQFTEVFCGHDNVVTPALPTGAVTPYSGTITTPFTYAVNFYSSAGATPTKAQVVIDNTPHDLKLSTGAAANGTYRYTTILPVGKHNYHFVFQYGQNVMARWPETGAVDYPDVYDPNNPWTPTPTPTATPTATQTATPTPTPTVISTPLATPVGQGEKLKLHLPLVKR